MEAGVIKTKALEVELGFVPIRRDENSIIHCEV